MKTTPHSRLALALLLCLASPAASRAASVGQVLDHDARAAGLAALAQAPPSLLPLCRDVSTLASARRQGLVAARDADRQLADLFEALSETNASLPELPPAALAMALTVETRTAVVEARSLLAVEGEDLHPDLARAVAQLITSVAEAASAPHAGADGPDNQCFVHFTACAGYCSTLDHWLLRAACTADCELDLVECLGRAAQRTNPFRKPDSPAEPGLSTP